MAKKLIKKAVKKGIQKVKQNLKEDSKDMLPSNHKKQPMNIPKKTVDAAINTMGATGAGLTAYGAASSIKETVGGGRQARQYRQK